ncbi:ScbR family autoregulator-binding transcription factor [Streptomyces sp. GESEQ-35]|uniref:ScbR family autoregulator-binding transcription factor n=1 Tax=Streptomyces sp. GESEQ-35 TaxID=2812657 RepID=UPI001B34367E|nr:ScbR family autoregulator-binding transcription factor [Streptomyces sp. GESEQ-35]
MVKQERAARTRMALIRAGAEVFAEDGLASTSLTTISSRAGVSTGALHFHFESKKALVQAIEAEALETVRQIVRDASTPGGSPLRALVGATYRLMSKIADDVVVRAGFELSDDPGRDEGPSIRREWQRWVEEVLLRADQDGWLADGVSADDAATAVVAATVGFEVLSGDDKAWLSEEKITGFWDLLLPRLTERHALVWESTEKSAADPETP